MENKAKLVIGNSQNMKSVQDNSVDFIFAGPPYWNHLDYSGGKDQLGNIDDYEHFHQEISKIWAECFRVLKPGSFFCVHANDLYEHDGKFLKWRIPLAEDFSRNIVKESFVPLNVIFWDSYIHIKPKKLPVEERKKSRSRYMIPQRMQYLMFFMKNGNNDDQAEKTKNILAKYYWQPLWRIKTQRSLLGSKILYKIASFVLTILPANNLIERPLIKKTSEKTIKDFRNDSIYPATIDTRIIKKILKDFTNEGDLVLDPFAGSGATLDVAVKIGRKCIGYEINSKTTKIVKERLKDRVNIFQD